MLFSSEYINTNFMYLFFYLLICNNAKNSYYEADVYVCLQSFNSNDWNFNPIPKFFRHA